MLGAIIGDIVGSLYEFNNIHTKKFNLFSGNSIFTDDTVTTVAVFKALKASKKFNYANLSKKTVKYLKKYGKKYPNLSYGDSYNKWLQSSSSKPYNSFGNGAAMRVSSVAYFSKSVSELVKLSKRVTEVTHNHIEGLKGAEATSYAIWLALNGASKEEIKKEIEKSYYSLNFDYEDLRANYKFNETCQETVPQAIYCFLIGQDFEDCIRTGISIGGDSDTLCAITGAIAEAYYGIPDNIKNQAMMFLDKNILKALEEFDKIKEQKIYKKR